LHGYYKRCVNRSDRRNGQAEQNLLNLLSINLAIGHLEVFAGALGYRQELDPGPEPAVRLSAPHDHAPLLFVDRIPKPDETGRKGDVRADAQAAIADVNTLYCQVDPFQSAELNDGNGNA